MKLFQRLLVAPAALGLLSPISANANEVNLNDISNYSDVENIELADSFNNNPSIESTLLAGGEGLVDTSYDGGFSTTTTASFSVDMAIGAVDGNTTSEALTAVYGYQMDLSTSFTGEDTLAAALKAGSNQSALAQLDLNSTTNDALTVDGISYTFPLGDKLTVLVGDSTSGSALYSTACVYGGFTNTLDDCGNFSTAFTATGHAVAGTVGFSAAYDIGNGFTGAVGYNGQGSDAAGLGTIEGTDFVGGQLTYTADNYGVSITYADLDVATGWGLNGYYTFASNLPSVSVGYEFGEVEQVGADDQETTQWFVGLQWDELGNGTLGVALGSDGPQNEGVDEDMAYEVFYTYNVNDSMTITPALFIIEHNQAGAEDETGVVVKTSFSF
ncbi:porin [Prochlorococcus marinus]